MMHYDFVVTLKKERKKSVDIISVLLLLLSIFAFLSVSLQPGIRAYLFPGIAIILVLALVATIYRNRRSQEIQFKFLLIPAGITWLAMPFTPWVSLPLFLLAFLEKPAKSHVVVAFSHEGILIRNFLKKHIDWESFNNVMLKDGILTLDFKDNRILQKELMEEGNETDEMHFNEYCRRLLAPRQKVTETV